jgi:hypothetical protein
LQRAWCSRRLDRFLGSDPLSRRLARRIRFPCTTQFPSALTLQYAESRENSAAFPGKITYGRKRN